MTANHQAGPAHYRLTVRRLVIGIGAAVLLLWSSRLLDELSYSTWAYGRNTSVLPIGLPVVVVEESRWHANQVATGEVGVVTSDPPDDDSAYPERLVSVRMDTGPHRGTVVPVRRTCLRAR